MRRVGCRAGARAAGTLCIGGPVRHCCRWVGCAGLRGSKCAYGLRGLHRESKAKIGWVGGWCDTQRVSKQLIVHWLKTCLPGFATQLSMD